MENVKDWLDKKSYYNSGLRTDRNHRIDLYLSDVLDEYRTELLRIHNVVATEGKCCGYFIPADGQTYATICETCGQEKHLHPQN